MKISLHLLFLLPWSSCVTLKQQAEKVRAVGTTAAAPGKAQNRARIAAVTIESLENQSHAQKVAMTSAAVF